MGVSRAKRYKLQKVTSVSGFLGDDIVGDVSIGPSGVARAAFWLQMLEFMQKSHFHQTEETFPENVERKAYR